MQVEIRRRSNNDSGKTRPINRILMPFFPIIVVIIFFGVFFEEKSLDMNYKIFMALMTGLTIWLSLYLCTYAIYSFAKSRFRKRSERKEYEKLIRKSNNFH